MGILLVNISQALTDYRIISDAVFAEAFIEILSSPDNKILVCLFESGKVTVFELPSLTIIFELELGQVEFEDYKYYSIFSRFIIFSMQFN
jgi:hypothetical protein